MKTITPTTSMLRMLASIRGEQWLIRPDKIQAFALSALEATERAATHQSGTSDDAITFADFYEMRPQSFKDDDSIGHVWIHGALLDACPPIYEKLGLVTRYETIMSDISDLLENGSQAIMLHADSPGGTVSGNVECADFVASIPVPVVSHVHGLACSACYKIISGASVIVANPSATIGNIGTILSWQDCSEFWKSNGIEFKAITSEGADLKSTFHLEPDEAQLKFLQESINEAGDQFRAHVEAGRAAAGASLSDEVWRAGWYSGAHAGELGLLDAVGSASNAKELALSMISPV